MTRSRGITLALAYTVFAVLATVVNIGTQELFLRVYEGTLSLVASVGMGTVTGLFVKYVLDKRYIFRFQADDAMHNTRTFLLYSLMGVLTTLIFWGFEFGFHYLFASKELRYLGGMIGLGIGYVSKYHLDKQFVFRKAVNP
jgi:putative flippase GtrA